MPEIRAAPGAPTPTAVEPGRARIVLAFGAVYVIWGSTYLGILWAIETLPPLSMAAARFLTAGAILYAWSALRGDPRPTSRHWGVAVVAGGLMLGGGNGAVVVAEQWVPSGLVALLIASVPLWLVVLDALFGSRTRPSVRARMGLLIGFLGVALLGGSPGLGDGDPDAIFGTLLVLGGSLTWAAGSLYLRYADAPPRPLQWVGIQMIAGGAVLALMAVVTGDAAALRPSDVSLRSWLALAYLIVFGAIVAYSAYIWLLKAVTPALVGTYAYVNPVIALLLGWLLAGEVLTFRSMVAAAIIVGSVIVIVSESSAPGLRGVPVSAPDQETA